MKEALEILDHVRLNFSPGGLLALNITIAYNGIALTGYSFSSVMRLPGIDRRTITIETGIQNSGLALVLMFNPKIFPLDIELGGMTTKKQNKIVEYEI